MAKRKTRSRRTTRRKKSVLTKNEFFLDKEDEDRLLLFVAGILFGTGVCVSVLLNALWYGGLIAAALGVVLLLIETR